MGEAGDAFENSGFDVTAGGGKEKERLEGASGRRGDAVGEKEVEVDGKKQTQKIIGQVGIIGTRGWPPIREADAAQDLIDSGEVDEVEYFPYKFRFMRNITRMRY